MDATSGVALELKNGVPNLRLDKPYVAGLTELRAQLGKADERWIICIEGPGGVGKSSLAFQIARWAAGGSKNRRLGEFPMLPVLLKSLGESGDKVNNVDEVVAESLRFIMDTPKISSPLLQTLLRSKRVLAIVDGVSEMPTEAITRSIRPDIGAVNTRASVLTSRWSADLPDSIVIRPQRLTLAFLDRVLDELIAVAEREHEEHDDNKKGRFGSDEREELRMRMKAVMEHAREGEKPAELPMIFLKLMVDRSYMLLREQRSLDELPSTLSELVTSYTAWLLRAERELPLAMRQARVAAHVCMGSERRPLLRSEERYKDKQLTREVLVKFVDAGLMVRFGDDDDPFYKFALDPVAEELDVARFAKDLRERNVDQIEMNDLLAGWAHLPEDFVQALRCAATPYRKEIVSSYPDLSARLWS